MAKSALRAIHLYPVKSIAGSGPGEAVVEPWGLAGDRRWMVVDAGRKLLTQRPLPKMALAHAEILAGGALRLSAPGMTPLTVEVPAPGETVAVEHFQDKIDAVPAGPAAAAWFCEFLGIEAELVHLDAPEIRRPIDPKYSEPGDTVTFADGFPLLLTTTSSLDALNSLIAQGDHADEGPLPMNRFRPNVVVDGTAPWAEDDWRRVRIGEVVFQVAKPSARCVVTTTDQHTAERGKEPLRTLARHRRFGDRLVFGQNLIPRGAGTIRIGDPFEILE
ncbi:MOSC domain-containing protein [Streptomyces gilvosporeus]|uniref:MOSC domain-containing protein n=1 Tax=Streptomyces gilvosporeus TaxID=553510 RepID=A0A1V0TMS7_9ACTN|nr:MOSC N-terminal beta barrel domain-containing protein [Streptomyces gilvosporeus]ARF54227.1 MOSC domain-containing protein [Streptomyces gilvosporeus]